MPQDFSAYHCPKNDWRALSRDGTTAHSAVNILPPVIREIRVPVVIAAPSALRVQPTSVQVMPAPIAPLSPLPVRSTHMVAFGSCTPAPAFSMPS